MSEPLERIRAAVNDIQTWLADMPNPGEAIVRQAIVLRLLDAAYFDIWNPAEVVPEETNATGNRADFLIRVGEGKFALELKGMNVPLSQTHYQQAATYAVNEGTRWAIVTNGRVWVVIDEHLPGRWEERIALKLELGQEDGTFAEDLASMLDIHAWQGDMFGDVVHEIRRRQQQRQDVARIKREKASVVAELQQKYKIPTFELAVEAAVEMNRLTEVERDVLLGISTPVKQDSNSLLDEDELDPPTVIAYRSNLVNSSSGLPSSLGFTYKTRGAEAHVRWETDSGAWIVRKGSTALDRLPPGDEFMREMRERLMREGAIRRLDHGLLEYVRDVEYSSASMAASHIAGGSRNGWDSWKDQFGRSASYYRGKDSS